MRQKRAFSIFKMRWIYLIAAIIIIGGIMSFGLIAFLFLDFDEKSAISMVWMIPPMLIVSYGLRRSAAFLIMGFHTEPISAMRPTRRPICLS